MLASLRPKAMRVLAFREEPTFCLMTSKISAVESHSAAGSNGSAATEKQRLKYWSAGSCIS